MKRFSDKLGDIVMKPINAPIFIVGASSFIFFCIFLLFKY